VAGDTSEAIAKLLATDGKSAMGGQVADTEPPIVFLFPGQGAQYVDMGRDLYESEAVFRTEVDRCAEILQKHLKLDIRSALYPEAAQYPEAEKMINQTSVTQPAIFLIEYALARLWMSWGIKPSALLGHSIGEYVAAVVAGTFTLDDALALLSARARLINALPGGSMLAVRMDGNEIQGTLPPELSVAAINSPKLCTISGPTSLLQSFQAELEKKKVSSRFLATSHAFHSAMMEPMIPEFVELARRTPRHSPKLPWISTCTGAWITEADVADPAYWARQLRQTVRFADAVMRVCEIPNATFLEAGPGQGLTQMMSQQPAKPRQLIAVPSLDATNPRGRDRFSMLSALARLWIAGARPEWGVLHTQGRRRVPLPTYPFERQRYWADSSKSEGVDDAGDAQKTRVEINGTEPEAPLSRAAQSTLAETIIHEQLRLMNQQLDALRTTPARSRRS
jgi:acyl transferase domain-containing protein